MYADCDGCRSRDWFGPNPWSEPGSAKHLDFVMGGTGGNILGVCGASPSRDNDYNTARPGHWGEEAKTTYKAGDVIDVAWCVSVATGVKATFQSSWGTSSYSGDGGVCKCEAREFLDVFSDADGSGGVTLSMAQWSWADKSESSAALAPGVCRNGDWDSLSESGAFLRAYVRDATRA